MEENRREQALQPAIDLFVQSVSQLAAHLLLCLGDLIRVRVVVVLLGLAQTAGQARMLRPGCPRQLLFPIQVEAALADRVSSCHYFQFKRLFMQRGGAELDSFEGFG